jgi:hypothetical protein
MCAAFCGSDRPIYCAQTTAPPVQSAVKMLMISTLSESTSETPETADSPTPAIMTTAARPTVIARSCSSIRGIMSCLNAAVVNIGRCPAGCISIWRVQFITYIMPA